MNNKKTGWMAAVALVFMLIAIGRATARDNNSASQPQDSSAAPQVQTVPQGKEMKILGIVVKRNADSFTMRDQSRAEYLVALTADTEVKTHKKGVFRGGKEYGVSYILRGLRLEASGKGNAEGQLVADTIRFDEDDLRVAQALEVRVDPVEKTADEAKKSAADAHNRINGLDDYDPVRTITVLFATGSSTLGPKGKAEIDSAAAWVKTQNTNGWVVSVVGFADTTGNTEPNRKLSERRANSVIGYLVTKHNLPLQRLVQPFGYGENNPVGDNTTDEGRTKNRRVEIRLMVNKGIAKIQ